MTLRDQTKPLLRFLTVPPALAPTFRFTVLFLIPCALACGGGEEALPVPTDTGNAPPADSATWDGPEPAIEVTFETRTVERQEGPSTASFAYPVIKTAPSTALRASLTREIDKFIGSPAGGSKQAATAEAAADQFLAEYRDVRHESPPWVLSRKVEIAYQDRRVVSLRLSEEIFVGGAHGGSTVHYATFQPITGLRLGLADLVTSANEGLLLELGERAFRQMHQIPPEQNLTDAGFSFEGGVFALSNEIAVLEDGLVIYYNPYEIASNAFGPTEIVIPRRDLISIAKPDGPLSGGPG